MKAWTRLLPHIEITLNLLRPSVIHPRMSAWEALNGAYDFDAHPLAPPGTAVTIHEKADQRQSWSKHGVKGWYLGPALDTYRCYTVWTDAKQSTRVTDTLAWHPHGYAWEDNSPLHTVTEAAEVLGKAIKHLADSDSTTADQKQPISTIVYDLQQQFQALRQIYSADNTEDPTEAPESLQITLDAHVVTPTAPEQRVRVTPPPSSMTTRQTARRQHQIHAVRESAASLQGLLPSLDQQVMRTMYTVNQIDDDHATSPERAAYIKKAVHRANNLTRIRRRYAASARRPGMALDSNGTPYFTPHYINTAVDLDDKGNKLTMKTALASPESDIWLTKHGEEISRLFDSDTIRLIQRQDVPRQKKPAYYNPQVKTKIKDGQLQYRVRGTIGGNHISYDGETAAHTASMQLIKIFLNSVVSTPDAKFMTADIKDFYLGTPLPTTEYMRITLDHIPADVISKYNMLDFAHNGAVIVAVDKGIYGLPQAGRLAQDRLVKHLANHGYHLADNTPCLFKHETNSVAFTLVVDDFGIKYTHSADADHLLAVLRELYIMTEDRALKQKYVGITIDHDRTKNEMTLSMPGYVDKALQRFGRAERRGARSPLTYIPPVIGVRSQETRPLPPEALEPVDATKKTFIQEVTGVFLFYSRAVDPTILTALNKISIQQTNPTKATLRAVDRLLSYVETYPNAHIIITRSDMQLCVQSDASYHSETGARSRAGGIIYFGCTADGTINGAIDYISTVIPTICASAAEAEYAALFIVGREATAARHILADLGHPQNTTTIVCDNQCAVGIANDEVKQKRSKAIDMRYHWIRDQVRQGKFTIKWEKGSENLADYFTKAHPVAHVVSMRRTYVTTPPTLSIKPCTRSRRVERWNTQQRTS